MDLPSDLQLPWLLFTRQKLPDPDEMYNQGVILLVDKPAGWTSFDVVKFVRNRIGVRKTGHAGTLDPMATGLLVLCCGKATRSVSILQDQPKRYLATVRFGYSTPSQDTASDPEEFGHWDHLDTLKIKEKISERFTGKIYQIPPMFSALRKDGKRLYQFARKGQIVAREPREVIIYENRLCQYADGLLELDILCSKGTYIRTLADDLGRALDSRAHLLALRRIASGGFKVEDALDIPLLRKIYSSHERNKE